MVFGSEFAAVYEKQWDVWVPRVWPFLKKNVGPAGRPPRTWLDLCCGTGSLISLARRARFEVTGVDVSASMLEIAKENSPDARIVRSDIRELELKLRYDVITCVFDSLNYLVTIRDIALVFKRVREHLGDGGVFIFDVNTYAGLQEQWHETTVTRGDEFTVIAQTSFDPRTALGRCLFTGFVRSGRTFKKFEEEHIERGYKPFEIEQLLMKRGFDYKKYDGYSFGRAKDNSSRLFYVCTVDS